MAERLKCVAEKAETGNLRGEFPVKTYSVQSISLDRSDQSFLHDPLPVRRLIATTRGVPQRSGVFSDGPGR